MTLPYGLIIIAAAALPCFFFIRLMDRFDRFKKEPRMLLFKLLAAGVVTPLAAMLLEFFTIPLCGFAPEPWRPAAEAFIGIAVVEEGVKLAALMIVAHRRREFDEILDGAVYAVTVAMGFALLENILYVFGSSQPISTALLRGFTAVPLHALAGGFMGLAVARNHIESKNLIGWGFLVAVVIHGAYDWILMDPNVPSGYIAVVLILGWALLTFLLRKARRDDIFAARHIQD